MTKTEREDENRHSGSRRCCGTRAGALVEVKQGKSDHDLCRKGALVAWLTEDEPNMGFLFGGLCVGAAARGRTMCAPGWVKYIS